MMSKKPGLIALLGSHPRSVSLSPAKASWGCPCSPGPSCLPHVRASSFQWLLHPGSRCQLELLGAGHLLSPTGWLLWPLSVRASRLSLKGLQCALLPQRGGSVRPSDLPPGASPGVQTRGPTALVSGAESRTMDGGQGTELPGSPPIVTWPSLAQAAEIEDLPHLGQKAESGHETEWVGLWHLYRPSLGLSPVTPLLTSPHPVSSIDCRHLRGTRMCPPPPPLS